LKEDLGMGKEKRVKDIMARVDEYEKVSMDAPLCDVLSVLRKNYENIIGKVQQRFEWLQTTFLDLVKQETQKKISEVMTPLHPLLQEDDTINKAVYVMFKENVRQPAVVRNEKIVGIVNMIDVFSVLLEVAGDQCFLKP
jgi:signal-transduction protein with cAMP-binding, CBS, and nucleotidyltransferase domain